MSQELTDIEALEVYRAEVKRLRDALTLIMDGAPDEWRHNEHMRLLRCRIWARDALHGVNE